MFRIENNMARNKNKNTNKIIFGLITIALFVAAMLVSRYFYQFMLIQGDSMKPTYHNLSLVIIDKHNRDFDRGDVIAFRCDGVSGVLVKRIVGVPGD
ncbi:MAG: signal peptidase I, partial [Wujia sp.]